MIKSLTSESTAMIMPLRRFYIVWPYAHKQNSGGNIPFQYSMLTVGPQKQMVCGPTSLGNSVYLAPSYCAGLLKSKPIGLYFGALHFG